MATSNTNQTSGSKPQNVNDTEILKGLDDYYYVRDSRFYGTKFIESLYYQQRGIHLENIRVGVIILTKQGNDVYICLVKENAIEKKWQKWGIPKGGMEHGSSLISDNDSDLLNLTAHREVYEELNYKISPEELGKCTMLMIDVPQRRDQSIDMKKMFVNGKFNTNISVAKPTLNVYFLYAFDGDKRGFDINDPYKGCEVLHLNSRLDHIWLKIDPSNENYQQKYEESNLSSKIALKLIARSLDVITFL